MNLLISDVLKKSCLHALCICCVLIIDFTLSEPTLCLFVILTKKRYFAQIDWWSLCGPNG